MRELPSLRKYLYFQWAQEVRESSLCVKARFPFQIRLPLPLALGWELGPGESVPLPPAPWLWLTTSGPFNQQMLKSTEQQGKRLLKLFWFSSKKPGRLFHIFAWNRKWIKLNSNWIQVSSLRYTYLDSRGVKLLRLLGNDGEHLEWNVKPPHRHLLHQG